MKFEISNSLVHSEWFTFQLVQLIVNNNSIVYLCSHSHEYTTRTELYFASSPANLQNSLLKYLVPYFQNDMPWNLNRHSYECIKGELQRMHKGMQFL